MAQRALRFVVGSVGLLFLIVGLTLLFAPGRQAGLFAILPSGSAGLSTVRADLAGLFLGMGALTLAGAVRGSRAALTASATLLGCIIVGRLASLIVDGSSPAALRSLAVELMAATAIVLTIQGLTRPVSTTFASKRRGALFALPALAVMVLGTAYLFQRELGLMLVRRAIDQGLSARLMNNLPDGLHVGLCGSGSPMPDPNRSGPCVMVIAGRHVYVVDVGEGGPRTLALMGMPPAAVEGVLLTHFHSDHIGGLGELMLQRWAAGGHDDPLPVHGPQGVESVVDGFNLAYGLDKGYRVAHHGAATVPPSGSGGVPRPFTIAEGSDATVVVVQQDGLTITAFPVNHAPIFPAVGYRFDYGGRSVVISGDAAPSPTLVTAATGADVLLHEGLQTTMVSVMHEAATRNNRPVTAKIMADIPSYHTTPEDAARMAQQAGVGQLVFYHTIPPLRTAYLNALFLGDAPTLYGGRIIVSTDGLLVTLKSGTTAITERQLL